MYDFLCDMLSHNMLQVLNLFQKLAPKLHEVDQCNITLMDLWYSPKPESLAQISEGSWI